MKQLLEDDGGSGSVVMSPGNTLPSGQQTHRWHWHCFIDIGIRYLLIFSFNDKPKCKICLLLLDIYMLTLFSV